MKSTISNLFWISLILVVSAFNIWSVCPPGHIKSALGGYGNIKFLESSKPGKKVRKTIKMPPGGIIYVGASACPVAFDSAIVNCVDEDGKIIAKKKVNLKNQCSPQGCQVEVIEIECRDEAGKDITISITTKGKRSGPIGIGYKE